MKPEVRPTIPDSAQHQTRTESSSIGEGAGEDVGGDEVIGRALRWSLALAMMLVVLAVFAYLLYSPFEGDGASRALPAQFVPDVAPPQVDARSFPPLQYSDVTAQAGINFVHFNGATGKALMPEAIGSGCAFFDFDNDGDQDILLVNCCAFPGHDQASPRPTMALYENDGHGHFRDVTAGSGLDVSFYGMGVAVGDYDGDGRTDVFVSALGSNHLFRNLGGGKFLDVTAKAGVGGDPRRWSTSCGFLDYNNDGRLDLFVCNYVDWSEEHDDKLDHAAFGFRDYIPPWQVYGTQNYLYRNNGDGTFTDVSREAGIEVTNFEKNIPVGKGLAVTFCDIDEDGWIDILVANDIVQCFLYHNQRDGTFREIAKTAGLAFGHNGREIDGMGIDAAYLYDDARLVVGVTNLSGNNTALFASQGEPLKFLDTVLSVGIAADTQRYTGWGIFFYDYDLDGRLDLFQCNGSIHCEPCAPIHEISYLHPCHLFWNCGPDGPVRLSSWPAQQRSPALEQKLMGRGAAFADIDGDGDLDILIAQNGRRPVLLRNDQHTGHHWMRLKLVGDGGNWEAIGARVEYVLGGRQCRRQVMPTRSFLSQVELPITIGLGDETRVENLQIVWPDATRQPVTDAKIDRLNVIHKTTPSSYAKSKS